MKEERGLLPVAFPAIRTSLPSHEVAQLILNYFKYNNFQDFNTWQQIAKTKLDYDYQERPQIFTCCLSLSWEDANTPTLSTQGQARTKKIAKRRALTDLITRIVSQGLISRGFRDQNFIEKLPRRRRNWSDQSSDQEEETIAIESRQQAAKWIEKGNSQLLLNSLKDLKVQGKEGSFEECWNYGLKNRSLSFLKAVLSGLLGKQAAIPQGEKYQKDIPSSRQFFDGSKVKFALREDLTDFISSYQLSKDIGPTVVREAKFKGQLLPSQNILLKIQTHTPTRQQMLDLFQPIAATQVCLKGYDQQKKTSFLGAYEEAEVPSFEGQDSRVSIKCLQSLYQLLMVYCKDFAFCVQVLNLVEKEMKGASIAFKIPILQKYSERAERYYLRHKQLLAAQFLELLSTRVTFHEQVTTIEGMLKPLPQQHNFTLVPSELDEKVLPLKVKRNNYSEFQESSQMSNREYVLIQSKFSNNQWAGQLVQISPSLRIKIPECQLTESHPVTLIRLCNAKLFQKTSSALVETSNKCMGLLSENVFLLWQPPSYPIITVISQLLIEWQAQKQTILVVSPHPDELSAQLSGLGFRVAKVGLKTQEKQFSKCNVVVSHPSFICCELLRNYAFSRVLVNEAQAVPEVSLLSAIVKDCKQLWMIGDPYLPRAPIASQYCRQRGMNISLFERLLRQGKKYTTYDSLIQSSLHHRNVLEWANKYVYGGGLRLLEERQQLPTVKGFPWPSYEYRICFLQVQSFQPDVEYWKHLAQICIHLVKEVLRTGFTQPEQIGCSTFNFLCLSILKQQLAQLLRTLGVNEAKRLGQLLDLMATVSSGSKYQMRDLKISLVGNSSHGIGDVVGALCQGRRGVILIGDCEVLSQDADWASFLGWCRINKLICTFKE